MDASQLFEVVGKQARLSEVAIVSEMTPREVEDLLDWIENQRGKTSKCTAIAKASRFNTVVPARDTSLLALLSCGADSSTRGTEGMPAPGRALTLISKVALLSE
jgi:hypothetical protein